MFKLFFMVCVLLHISSAAYANGKILKVMASKQSVVVPRSEGAIEEEILVFLDSDNNKVAKGVVSQCKQKSCLVKITYLGKHKTLSDFASWRVFNKKKEKFFVDLTIGTPMGFGAGVGLGAEKKNWLLGGSLGFISQKYNSLPATGLYFSGDFSPKALNFAQWFRSILHVGYVRLTNKLGEVSTGADDKVLSAFFVGASAEAYIIHKNWEAFFRLSLTYNNYESSVEASNSSEVSIPYAGVVMAPLVGVRKIF